jgi:manganese/iron transport system permease protein
VSDDAFGGPGLGETLHLFLPSLLASLLTAIACALAGIHVAARRATTVGLALPQAAALGIALSFACHGVPVLGDHDVAAALAVLAAAGILALARGRTRLPGDAVAGIVFVAAASLSILVVQRIPQGLDEIRHLVEGNMLAVHEADLPGLAVLLVPVIAFLAIGGRRLTEISLDRDMAAVLGVRTGLWDIAFTVALAATVSVGVHATGTLFVFGGLLLPAAVALRTARSTAGVHGTAVAAGVVGAGAGFVAACAFDLPPGPAVCVAHLAVFGAASLLRR